VSVLPAFLKKRGLGSDECGLLNNFKGALKIRILCKNFKSPVSHVLTRPMQPHHFWTNLIWWDGPFKVWTNEDAIKKGRKSLFKSVRTADCRGIRWNTRIWSKLIYCHISKEMSSLYFGLDVFFCLFEVNSLGQRHAISVFLLKYWDSYGCTTSNYRSLPRLGRKH
jgi:hypothetical protein